jgi:hypothetical protein
LPRQATFVGAFFCPSAFTNSANRTVINSTVALLRNHVCAMVVQNVMAITDVTSRF